MSWRDPHHDGSERYVSDPTPRLGDTVSVSVCVPDAARVERIHVRVLRDGEPEFHEATVDHDAPGQRWWRVDLLIHNPVTSYRFLLQGGVEPGYRWLTAAGVVDHDVTDATDFRVVTFPPPPSWAAGGVFYEIFLDRFASSGARRSWPTWARPAAWDDPPVTGPEAAMHQVYGGDLLGVLEHLDHLEDLGINALYLTPFFPAPSNHRYNATTFEQVDPLLGGDRALADLTSELHARRMHVIGDLTLNHSGDSHEWFRTAQADPGSPEAEFYLFDGAPDRYAAWLDVPTLPKFDHRSDELARRLYAGTDSVVARWLQPPYSLDGWRIDVANMAGRHGQTDRNAWIARTTRRTVEKTRPRGLLLAEHAHDASGTLSGDGWHGTMAYAGFTRPVWSWLVQPGADVDFLGVPGGVPRLGGPAVVAAMREFAAAIPWRSLTHSMTLLDSHDTARFRTVTGDRDAHLVGVGLLATYPGIPMVFAGDEIGVEGASNEAARRPMPWDRATWDRATHARYRELLALRRRSSALQRGGLRWLHVSDDVLVFLRESRDERVLVQAARAAHRPVTLPQVPLAPHGGEALLGGDDLRPAAGILTLPSDGPAFHAWRV